MSDYNGWTNRATFLANMWLDRYITSIQHDGLRVMPDDLEAYVDTLFDQQCDSICGLFRDMLSGEIASINFREIANEANKSNVWED
jgi:hypothetical protein